MLARVSLSLPEGHDLTGIQNLNDYERLETIYSFVGTFTPAQDIDCIKQEKIQNVQDPAEIYRQAIQNALVSKETNEGETVQKTSRNC